MKRGLFFIVFTLLGATIYAQTYSGVDSSVFIATGTTPVVVESKTEPGTYFVAYQRSQYLDTTNNSAAYSTRASYALYVQKVGNGKKLWSKETLVSKKYTGAANFSFNMIATSDSGCAMVFYHRTKWGDDPSNISLYKVSKDGALVFETQLSTAKTTYVAGFDPTGNVEPTPSDVAVYGSSRMGGDLVELPNRDIVAAWFNQDATDNTTDASRIYANRVTPEGVPYYTLDTGVKPASAAVANNAYNKALRVDGLSLMPYLTLDTTGGTTNIFFTYGNGSGNSYKLYIQKLQVTNAQVASSNTTERTNDLRPTGNLWGSGPFGNQIAIHSVNRIFQLTDIPRAKVDGDGGAIVAYQAKRTQTSTSSNCYVQQVSSTGALRFKPDSTGMQIAFNNLKSYSNPLPYYYKEREALIFSWFEGSALYSSYGGLGMQRLDMVSGELEWGTAGRTVVEPTYGQTIMCQAIDFDSNENPSFMYRRNPLSTDGYSAILVKKLDLNGFEEVQADILVSPTTQKLLHAMVFSSSTKKYKGIAVWVKKSMIDNQGEVRFQEFTY